MREARAPLWPSLSGFLRKLGSRKKELRALMELRELLERLREPLLLRSSRANTGGAGLVPSLESRGGGHGRGGALR